MKNRMSQLSEQLAKASGISDTDINANRAGKISKQQCHLLRVQAIASFIFSLPLLGLGLLAMWGFRGLVIDESGLTLNPQVWLLLFLFAGIPLLAGTYLLWQSRTCWQDQHSQQAASVTGEGWCIGRHSPQFIWIGGRLLVATGVAAAALRTAEAPYTIFYGPRSCVVFAVVPALPETD